MSMDNPIPKEDAERLCNEISNEYKGKWLTLAGWQCWECNKFAKENKCFNKPPDYRGCNLVNKRFDKK